MGGWRLDDLYWNAGLWVGGADSTFLKPMRCHYNSITQTLKPMHTEQKTARGFKKLLRVPIYVTKR